MELSSGKAGEWGAGAAASSGAGSVVRRGGERRPLIVRPLIRCALGCNVFCRSSAPSQDAALALAEGVTADDAANAAIPFDDGADDCGVAGDVGEGGEGAINEAGWGVWGWDTTAGAHAPIDDHRGGNPQDGFGIQADRDMFVTAADADAIVDDPRGGDAQDGCGAQAVTDRVTQDDGAVDVEQCGRGMDGGN